MGLTPAEIRALLDMFEASTWQEMTIDIGEDHLHVSRRANGAAAPAPPAAAPPAPATATAAAPVARPAAAPLPVVAPGPPAGNGHGVPVSAPSVGLFWRSPAPGAPPFVDVGSRVGPDDTIAIIEVMKLMSPLKAGLSGVVTAILAENGATVARGDALVLVDPEA
ncbi:MAG: acetyl-CoA carboxylase biotin carboxyl carrier protein [Actinomycetota bacterium]|jgi:acetyl-CoA carboxylase biotin carboxyl carrier protein|nr:acetyl-CoA carboxylase biotin carboxyl carrier protein [Actinomycetota bacterium]